MKSIIFVSLLVAAIAIPLAEAQIGLPLPRVITVNGTVSCSVNVSVPGTTLTPFPNATVQLQCGGRVVSTTITTGTGNFLIALNSSIITTDLLALIFRGGCRVVVTTPLATCNVTLGSQTGLLASVLQLITNIPGLPAPGIPVLPGLPGIPAIPVPPPIPVFPILLELSATIFALFTILPI